MSSTPNLHEQRRRSTHEALRRAALASFANKGFANVTVTELAREAGVTERTFFRHFPTKEAVLFQDYDTQVQWLSEALAHRPASESLFEAVLASVASFPYDLEVVRQAATARTELISAERIASHLRVVQASFAAVITGFAGSLFAHHAHYLNPNDFTFWKSIEVLLMVAVGGIGSLAGAIVGAFVITLLPEYLRVLDEYRMVIFGAMLIAFMGLGHRGLAGLSAAVAMRLLRLRPQSDIPSSPTPHADAVAAPRWSRQ